MDPEKINIKIIEGTLQEQEFQWLIKTPDKIVSPVDISYTTAKMQVRRSPSSSEVLDELTTENGRIVYTDPTQGKFKIVFPPDLIPTFNEAFYDVKIFFTDTPDIRRIIEGKIFVSKAITK